MSKSGKPRVVALNDTAIKTLDIVKALAIGGGYAFPNINTKQPYRNITLQWHWVLKKANLQGLHVHDLRHSFASFLINGGRTLYEVQHLLGHSSARMTERYAHLNSGTKLAAAQAADKALSSLYVTESTIPISVNYSITDQAYTSYSFNVA